MICIILLGLVESLILCGMYSYIPTLNTSLKTSIHSRIVAVWLKIPA